MKATIYLSDEHTPQPTPSVDDDDDDDEDERKPGSGGGNIDPDDDEGMDDEDEDDDDDDDEDTLWTLGVSAWKRPGHRASMRKLSRAVFRDLRERSRCSRRAVSISSARSVVAVL